MGPGGEGPLSAVSDVIPLLLPVTRILDDLGIRCVVGGSLASGVHGELRATNDVDLLIELPSERIGAFVNAMTQDFDIWEDTVRAAIDGGRSFGCLHVAWHTKVDFFPLGRSPLEAREVDRRVPLRLPAEPTRDVYFASPEDSVPRKLEWYRRSDGILERQLRDVVGVLELQAEDLDLDLTRSPPPSIWACRTCRTAAWRTPAGRPGGPRHGRAEWS